MILSDYLKNYKINFNGFRKIEKIQSLKILKYARTPTVTHFND